MRLPKVRSVAVLVGLLALAACGDGGDGGASDPGSDTSTTRDETREETNEVSCGRAVFERDALEDAPPLEALPDDPAGPASAVDDLGEPAFDPTLDWKVVFASEERVELLRALDAPIVRGDGDVRTHESRTLEHHPDGFGDVPGTWFLMAAGECTPRLVAPAGMGVADLTLGSEPQPDDTSLDVLVLERACANGETADGRVELLALEETDDEIRLHIGVRPREGASNCPGHPPTPFTVELDQPVGERTIVDVAIVPPRALAVATG